MIPPRSMILQRELIFIGVYSFWQSGSCYDVHYGSPRGDVVTATALLQEAETFPGYTEKAVRPDGQ